MISESFIKFRQAFCKLCTIPFRETSTLLLTTAAAFSAIRWFQAATKKQKYEKISEKKMSTPVEVLCKVTFFWAAPFFLAAN